MNSPSPETTAAQARCQYRTPAGRRCALHILDPRSSFCPRHASAQVPDSQDFSALILKNAGDFDDPIEIKRALTSLFKLLASGRITSRRAKALAYIAGLVLRTLRDSNAAAPIGFDLYVPPRGKVGMTGDAPQDPSSGRESNNHVPQSPDPPPATSQPTAAASAAQSAAHSSVDAPTEAPSTNVSHVPAIPPPTPAAPSVYYGHPPIRPYNGEPPLRSCPLPARRPTRHFRAALLPTPLTSHGWKT